jgi:hypothetical protein
VAEGLIEEDAVSDAVDDAEGGPGEAEPETEAEPENELLGEAGREGVN